MKNHLIIGLGGTGGKIIRSFRKTIYQEFRKENPDGVHIAYLYMDSSTEMMDLNDPSWKVLGHSVQLGQNSQLKISGANLQNILDNIHNYPGIKNWIGDKKQWKDILSSIVGETLGGQKRRLGRFLFANRVDEFNARIRHLVSELEHESGTAAITFHICCGLAGGTGGGSLADVIAQIRSLGFSDHQTYRLILYAMLPDSNPPQNWDTGNYHANGYAALAELNALSTGILSPHDLTGKKDRISVQDPFNGCYVFTNRNENGMTVDVDRDMPDIVADFLYQKIVAVKDVEDWPQNLGRMENAENGDGIPETSPGTGNPARSKRFLAFGIKRLAVPEEEILEYMTYSFTSQAALHLLYNNWQDGLGFQDEAKHVDFRVHVQESDVQSRWKMKDDHICLSLGILEDDAANRRWKPILDEWKDFITNSKITIRESVPKKTWVDELEKICERRFSEDYRTLGVAKFYDAKLKAKKEMAKHICGLAESDLFDEWRTGVKSMHEASRMLEDLISVTEERIKTVEDKKARLESRRKTADEFIEKKKREWSDIGIVGKITGRPDNVFDAIAGHLQELYVCRTWSAGWDFARKLLEELKEAFTDLKIQVDECFSRVRQSNDIFKAKMDSRCNDREQGNLKKHMIRYYSPELVKNISSRFVKDESVQSGQVSNVRSFIVKMLGEYPGFRTFNRNISVMRFMDTLEAECEKSVKRTHDIMIQTAGEKLLGVSIIERLRNQYGANQQELRSFIADLVKFAGNYVSFSEQERNKRGEGIPVSPNCITEFTAILPKAPEHSDFMEVLKKTVRESRTDRVNIIEADSKPNEITLISITNLFPLRFLAPLQRLKEKYDQRIKDLGKERASLELHIEGDGSGYSDMFVETSDVTAEKGIPHFILAKAAGLVFERENRTTGARTLSVMTKDEDGFDNEPVDFGSSMADVSENLDTAKVNLLIEEVRKILSQKEYLHAEKQKELIQAMNAEVDAVKAERGIDDDVYRLFLKSAKEAAKILKQRT